MYRTLHSNWLSSFFLQLINGIMWTWSKLFIPSISHHLAACGRIFVIIFNSKIIIGTNDLLDSYKLYVVSFFYCLVYNCTVSEIHAFILIYIVFYFKKPWSKQIVSQNTEEHISRRIPLWCINSFIFSLNNTRIQTLLILNLN